MFRNRKEAARQLALRLQDRLLYDPLVLAIPRGGVVTGAVLARELDAELDVVLSRKLRSPAFPEAALGAITEEGQVYLNHCNREHYELLEGFLANERRHQLAQISRSKQVYRAIRPKATLENRSVILTDDGIATGATMIAALQTIQREQPDEVIVAVPVAPADQLPEIREWCDEVICLHAAKDFWAVGQFYMNFEEVDDEDVCELLREANVPKVKLTSVVA